MTLDGAGLARKGLWPVAGGWLDQTETAVEAFRLLWREENAWRAKRGLPTV